ncbi:hypothetical protein D3C86_647590 [compost metagenome]
MPAECDMTRYRLLKSDVARTQGQRGLRPGCCQPVLPRCRQRRDLGARLSSKRAAGTDEGRSASTAPHSATVCQASYKASRDASPRRPDNPAQPGPSRRRTWRSSVLPTCRTGPRLGHDGQLGMQSVPYGGGRHWAPLRSREGRQRHRTEKARAQWRHADLPIALREPSQKACLRRLPRARSRVLADRRQPYGGASPLRLPSANAGAVRRQFLDPPFRPRVAPPRRDGQSLSASALYLGNGRRASPTF